MRKNIKRVITVCLIIFLSAYLWTAYHHTHKELPKGIPYEGEVHHLPAESISFLYDLTYKKGDRQRKDQHIFRSIFQAIDEAEDYIVLDLFLYNDYYDHDLSFPSLSSTLTEKLVAKKKENPQIKIILITDEINTSYGSHENWQFEKLKKNGIEVVLTDVSSLRDSNPLYSSLWRIIFQRFGQEGKGWLPNAMADTAPDMTARSYLKLLNVKANHRKTVTTEKTSFVISANPHDASANHSNAGFRIDGAISEDILKTEQAAVDLSGGPKLPEYQGQKNEKGDHAVQLVTEGKVLDRTLSVINSTEKGDELRLAMFYLAERKVIDALLDADKRGVQIKIILDPNENAFGAKKTGLPNKPVANEFKEKTKGHTQIRWYNTGQEQYHPKLMYAKKKDKVLIVDGSTNFTARNLDNLNLETDVYIEAPKDSPVVQDLDQYFERQWKNKDGDFTKDLEENLSPLTFGQQVVYLLQKVLDFTTF